MLAAADAAASWPPAAAIGPLQDALARAAALGITDGNDVDAAKAAIASAERIAALAAEGAEVQPRRKAAAKAAEDWQVARKVEGLRAEGEKVISKRAEGAQKLQAYVKETRAAAIVGDWADADGMLCRLKQPTARSSCRRRAAPAAPGRSSTRTASRRRSSSRSRWRRRRATACRPATASTRSGGASRPAR